MTDNGLAALAERLKPYQMPDPWTDDLRTVVMVGTAEEVAAAILRNGAVFLPEGLGPVMVGMAKEIVSYADAHLDLCRLIVSYADLTPRVVAEGGELREISDEWTKVVSAARAALSDDAEVSHD